MWPCVVVQGPPTTPDDACRGPRNASQTTEKKSQHTSRSPTGYRVRGLPSVAPPSSTSSRWPSDNGRPRGTVLHSDQGLQYGSGDWRRFCRTNHLEPSMSRSGNCWDNAVAVLCRGRPRVAAEDRLLRWPGITTRFIPQKPAPIATYCRGWPRIAVEDRLLRWSRIMALPSYAPTYSVAAEFGLAQQQRGS
jgi:hypothetical protein